MKGTGWSVDYNALIGKDTFDQNRHEIKKIK